MPPKLTVPQLCMLTIRRIIQTSPSSPSFMDLSARVIPKASVLLRKLKSLRLGGQQLLVRVVLNACSVVTEWRGEVLTLGSN